MTKSDKLCVLTATVREAIKTVYPKPQSNGRYVCLVTDCSQSKINDNPSLPSGETGFALVKYLRDHYKNIHGLLNSEIAKKEKEVCVSVDADQR